MGGTSIQFGNDVLGQAITATLPPSGGWNLSRIADISLAQSAYQLANEKRIWLPTMSKAEIITLPTTAISTIGEIGPYHADINGSTPTGGIRGPFIVSPKQASSTPTFPSLWAHEANFERTILFGPDSECIPKRGSTLQEQEMIDRKISDIWNTASYCHFNRDFRFNSQSTGMQLTPVKTIGGRAWLSIQLLSIEQEKALVLWANTTFGLLLYWWISNKQQSGRGSIGKLTLQNFPVLDVTALTPSQLNQAVILFNAMSDKKLKPVHEIDTDIVRKELDDKFSRIVLGLPEKILKPGGPLELPG